MQKHIELGLCAIRTVKAINVFEPKLIDEPKGFKILKYRHGVEKGR